MQIIEKFLEGKNPDQQLCEDGIFQSDDFVAVIDGATAKSKIEYDGKSSGRAAMEKVKQALKDVPADADVCTAIDIITGCMAEWYRNLGIYEHLQSNYIERPSASAVIYSHQKKEIWQIGDCLAIVDDKHFYNNKILDEIMINARVLYLEMQIQQGKTIAELINNDIGREFILPLLQNQGCLQNNFNGSEYAWEVFDGFPLLKERVKIIDASKAKTLILASDGYPKLFNTLQESEEYLKYVLQNDPLCFTINKGTKALKKGNNSFDDRAYIKIEL